MTGPQQAYSVGPPPPPEARRLHLNEYRFHHSPTVIAELQKESDETMLTQYQSGPTEALTADIARYIGAPSAAYVLIAPGSDDALRAAIDTSTLRGHSSVIAGTPGYTHFEHYCRLKPLKLIQYAIGLGTSAADHIASLCYYEDELRAGCLVYMCSPNNPTGDLWSPDAVASLATTYPRSLFLVDEAYIEFAAASVSPQTIREEIEQASSPRADALTAARRLNWKSCVSVAVARDNVVVTRTFSKAFGLAAQRIGYAVARPKLVTELGIAVSPKAFGPMSCRLASAALHSANHYWLHALLAKQYAELSIRTLRELGWWIYDTPGNYFLLYAGSGTAAATLTATAAANGIALRNRDELPGLAGFVRITAGNQDDAVALVAMFLKLTPPAECPPQALFTGKGRVAAIKVLMRKTLRLLSEAGVVAWAQGGTMLGIQRHGGMIPSDDDGDLAYEVKGCDSVASLVGTFAKAGLTLQRNRTNAYWQIGTNPPAAVISPEHIDLFSYSLIADNSGPSPTERYVLDDPRFAKEEPDSKQAHCNTSYSRDELFPLRDGRFYDLTINMPAQSDAVLCRALGDDYMRVMRIRVPGRDQTVNVVLRDLSPA